MAKNRRSGNNNSGEAAVYGNDISEFLIKESAQLITGSTHSEKPQNSGQSSKLKAEETVDLSEKSPNGRGRKAKQKASETKTADKPVKRADKSGTAPKKPDEAAESKVKRARKSKRESEELNAADRSKKSSRKIKLLAERTSAEITGDKPQIHSRKVNTDISGSVAETEVIPKKRAKRSVSAAEVDSSHEEKTPDPDDGAGLGGCKTRQVMKLIEGDNDNLVVFAGKSRVPSLLRGRESLSAMMRRNAAGIPEYDDTEVVNITELVIRHEAAEILDRFNACSCEKCVKVFSEIIEKRIPVRYARISRSELDSGELPERAVPMRQIVLPEMIRQLISNKKRCFHDE